MQNTKSYVDSLFKGYEETKNLADFKEELTGFLNDKIADFVRNGLSEDGAFQKATTELGDISVLADGMNLQRKQEIINEAFMDIRHFMKPWRVVAYIFCGLLFVSGAICAAIVYFAANIPSVFPFDTFNRTDSGHLELFCVLFVFVPLAISGFVFLHLTQESSSRYPMPIKRALWYTAATMILTVGIIFVPLTWFAVTGKEGIIATIGVLIPFALPAIGIIIFLIFTEKDRKKPWVKQLWEKEVNIFSNSSTQLRFGLFSGAIWIAAAALFILLGFAVSFKISWIIFLFAIAAQLCVQGVMMKIEYKKEN